MRTRYKIFISIILLACASAVYFYFLNVRARPPQDLSKEDLLNHLENLRLPDSSTLKPVNKALATFGKKLFFDTSFSANASVSCASCHIPEHTFTDKRPFAQGIGETSRHAPTIVNSVLNAWFFWDGRADSLSAQAAGPLEHPLEHGVSRTKFVAILYKKYRTDYESLFGPLDSSLLTALPNDALPRPEALELSPKMAAYALTTIASYSTLSSVMREAAKYERSPAKQFSLMTMQDKALDIPNASWYAAWDAMTLEQRTEVEKVFNHALKAIAAYEESLYSKPSSFDDFANRLLSDPAKNPREAFSAAFGETEFQGLTIFLGKGQCVLCHNGPNFTDNQFHNTGLKQLGDHNIDIGRARGVLLAMKSPMNCLSLPKSERDSESCRELPFLDDENLELMGAFKTPTLRHVVDTPPYMHDGRFATLNDVLNFYSALDETPAIGHREESLKPFDLNASEQEALLHFLGSLSSGVYER